MNQLESPLENQPKDHAYKTWIHEVVRFVEHDVQRGCNLPTLVLECFNNAGGTGENLPKEQNLGGAHTCNKD